jgi:hypothetical protein
MGTDSFAPLVYYQVSSAVYHLDLRTVLSCNLFGLQIVYQRNSQHLLHGDVRQHLILSERMPVLEVRVPRVVPTCLGSDTSPLEKGNTVPALMNVVQSHIGDEGTHQDTGLMDLGSGSSSAGVLGAAAAKTL